MTDDAFKKAENRGYSRGYAAGKVRTEKDITLEQYQQADQDFLERAFLAALPVCIAAHDWKIGDEPITSVDGRTRLAWNFAEAALKQKRHAP